MTNWKDEDIVAIDHLPDGKKFHHTRAFLLRGDLLENLGGVSGRSTPEVHEFVLPFKTREGYLVESKEKFDQLIADRDYLAKEYFDFVRTNEERE